MSETLARVKELVSLGRVRPSSHGYSELNGDGILYAEVLTGLPEAVVVEDYPDAMRGPTVLSLQRDAAGHPIHIVWGFRREDPTIATIVTGYRPNPSRWSADFMRRKDR
ncbi:MAG: DUF4258 domain-containing protein [Thermomicrobiales bacterium]|nr:DUF4258 domain-containing protein [Thermomicrobiales bacterium]